MAKGWSYFLLAMSGCALEIDPDFYSHGPSPAASTTGADDDGRDGATATGASSGGTGSTTPGSEGSSGEAGVEPTLPCAGESLGSAVGVAVAVGTTENGADIWDSSCGESSTHDALYEWSAPSSGIFEFETSGSRFDTVVAVLAGCDGPEIACDDDAGEHLWSSVRLELEAGETVLIVIDGWTDGEGGLYQLNIWKR